jgi:hypothetical protein
VTDTTWILIMIGAFWTAAVLLAVGIFYGYLHAGRRYPLLGLILAAVLLWGQATWPLRSHR